MDCVSNVNFWVSFEQFYDILSAICRCVGPTSVTLSLRTGVKNLTKKLAILGKQQTSETSLQPFYNIFLTGRAEFEL